MRRLGALCLAFGLAAPALAVDPPTEEKPSVPLWRWLLLGEREPAAPPRAPVGTAGTRPSAAPSQESIAKQMAEEQRLFLERLKAISKIKEIAYEQGDEGMLRKAEDLEAQAEELFRLRTVKLRGMGARQDDQAALERGRDDRPATAERPPTRRPSARGKDR